MLEHESSTQSQDQNIPQICFKETAIILAAIVTIC